MPALLYLLALAVFAQGTSEFALAGLVPGIAADLDVAPGRVGMLTSGSAQGMVVGAPLMAVSARWWMPTRWTLGGLLAVFVAAHGYPRRPPSSRRRPPRRLRPLRLSTTRSRSDPSCERCGHDRCNGAWR